MWYTLQRSSNVRFRICEGHIGGMSSEDQEKGTCRIIGSAVTSTEGTLYYQLKLRHICIEQNEQADRPVSGALANGDTQTNINTDTLHVILVLRVLVLLLQQREIMLLQQLICVLLQQAEKKENLGRPHQIISDTANHANKTHRIVDWGEAHPPSPRGLSKNHARSRPLLTIIIKFSISYYDN